MIDGVCKSEDNTAGECRGEAESRETERAWNWTKYKESVTAGEGRDRQQVERINCPGRHGVVVG